MDQLNPPQQKAVEHLGSPLLVLAGAGSGKTRVVTRKIAWLINERAVQPADITAVTFTNKAAREMKQRVEQTFADPADAKGVTISTFHSLGMKILRRQAREVDLHPDFSIIDPRDSATVLADMLRADQVGNKDLVERVGRRISQWKNLGRGPEQVTPDPQNPMDRMAHSVYPGYQRYLRACNSVDLDDLIFLPVKLLSGNAEICRLWQLQIRYLLVDEYQDTNGAQYELIRLLAQEGRRLTVVGDDDQSIYAWRGALPQNLSQLETDFADLTVIKLEQNYRSCGRILKVANKLIGQNPRVFDKNLWSNLGYGEPVNGFVAKSAQHEAEKVISAIMRHQFRHRSDHGDFAILYRSNHQSRELEIALREMRIPYRISGGSSFFDRSEIRDVMAYLRLLANPSDDSALLRIINSPRRGIGTTSLEKLAVLASKRNQSLFETLSDRELEAVLKTRQVKVLREFASRMMTFRQAAEQGDSIQVVKDLLEFTEYRIWLGDTCEPVVAESRWENIALLINWLESASRKSDSNATLAELVRELILNDVLDQQQQDQDRNVVNLMTLHGAKGLEFPHVFIVGVEEEILPHRVSVAHGDDEEERRLFYVGITRAMKTLTLSYTRHRKRFGDLISCEPSRFIAELPADEIRWDTDKVTDPAQLQDTGRAHLASIRALRNQRNRDS